MGCPCRGRIDGASTPGQMDRRGRVATRARGNSDVGGVGKGNGTNCAYRVPAWNTIRIRRRPGRKRYTAQLKAERKAGKMLGELERGQTSGLKRGPLCQAGTTVSPYAAALEENDIPRRLTRLSLLKWCNYLHRLQRHKVTGRNIQVQF